MSQPTDSPCEFDLRPDPRILPMLGEINLSQWSCLAELVDNSVDAFLAAKRRGESVREPEVHIAIPTSDAPTAKITVRDNGPGMDGATLEKAVRAGWTGNDPLSSLGMFGMGFNIATARLGRLTKVWTTRSGDAEWHGLEIDFDTLIRQRHFRTPRLLRPKNDPHESGTEITIERLKPEQRQWFVKTANRSRVGRELGRVYSSMLRANGMPLSVRLWLHGTVVRGRDHCVWGGEGSPTRCVQTARYGSVSAYQAIDVPLGGRSFCTECWQWLPVDEHVCPACSSSQNVVIRERRVYGWLGIQRYLSQTDYGIDFLRHGRKIECGNRDLFSWSDGPDMEPEYPIDDPRNRGRIVGEIHIDHCRVTYTKDRFDRNDPAWQEMVDIVRGDAPLRPERAEQLGRTPNTSYLSLLFQAFRRSSPKPKVAGSYARLLLVPDNDRAEDMAKRFYAGEPEYQTDAKWWELVDEADRKLVQGDSSRPETLDGWPQVVDHGGTGVAGSSEAAGGVPTHAAAVPLQTTRAPLSTLSREYRDQETDLRWDIQAYEVQPTDPALGGHTYPWAVVVKASGILEFLVNASHKVFSSATMTPLDGLLAELAWRAIDFQRPAAGPATFASVLASLRARYAGTTSLDPITLGVEAASILTEIARSLSRNIESSNATRLFSELSPGDHEAIRQKMAARSVASPQQIIVGGRFLEFAPRKTLLCFIERHPELFFDGRYWETPYCTLDYGTQAATGEAQSQTLRYYVGLLTDAMWLAEQEAGDLASASRARLLRAGLALELLSGASGGDGEA